MRSFGMHTQFDLPTPTRTTHNIFTNSAPYKFTIKYKSTHLPISFKRRTKLELPIILQQTN